MKKNITVDRLKNLEKDGMEGIGTGVSILGDCFEAGCTGNLPELTPEEDTIISAMLLDKILKEICTPKAYEQIMENLKEATKGFMDSVEKGFNEKTDE